MNQEAIGLGAGCWRCLATTLEQMAIASGFTAHHVGYCLGSSTRQSPGDGVLLDSKSRSGASDRSYN